MTPADALIVQAMQLSDSEKSRVAHAILLSLPVDDDHAEGEHPFDSELSEELDRRWAEYQADPESALPWEVVRQRLRNELKSAESDS